MDNMCFKCRKTGNNFFCHQTLGDLCADCYKELSDVYSNINVYRFIPAQTFLEIIDTKSLMFTIPSVWSDSFEDLIFKLMLIARKTCLIDPVHIREILANRDSYYCQCWTFTSESSFFWRKYGHDNSAVRIEINLLDAFDLGLRIEPVYYTKILDKKGWKKYSKIKPATEDAPNLYHVNEDGFFEGDFRVKTEEMWYADELLSFMHGISEREIYYDFEKISIPKMLSTKRLQYKPENEVRLFISACKAGDENIYSLARRDYLGRLYSLYNNKKADITPHMPRLKAVSFAKKPNLIKSILCHPNMPDDIYSGLCLKISESELAHVFKGKSSLSI